MKRIYLDYAATTPTDPLVIEAMKPYFFEKFGNPSSIHSEGQIARKAIEDARQIIASFLGAKPEEIVFTCGGTESNNFALEGVAFANEGRGNHIIISAIEHHAVIEPAKFLEKKGFRLTILGVDKYGLVDPSDVKKAITDKTILISIMHANNEIGTIEPIEEIGKIAREKGIYFHTDAVQTVGHIPVNVDKLNVDLLSLSAHKFYGPKGVGALYIRKGTRIFRFLHGGDQEKGRRASTHNTPGIVGMAKAIQLCKERMVEEMEFQSKLRDFLIRRILENIPDVCLNGHPNLRLPNNVNFSIKYIEGESMILHLDLLGVSASTGSACTSSSLEPSHVLLAIGLSPEVAHGSIRFTLGRWTTEEDINYVCREFPKVVEKLRKLSPLYNK
ncbi:MAG: cysteine desulfurase NifS [Candidatus Omnitrophica bacterium]|nr:cysteine desulfurase NifS [Candidatus Omnitrophota bacterium]MCM8799661.1 cysteine desulfurase NifS [Candidatus Omnitrophota bacterium]